MYTRLPAPTVEEQMILDAALARVQVDFSGWEKIEPYRVQQIIGLLLRSCHRLASLELGHIFASYHNWYLFKPQFMPSPLEENDPGCCNVRKLVLGSVRDEDRTECIHWRAWVESFVHLAHPEELEWNGMTDDLMELCLGVYMSNPLKPIVCSDILTTLRLRNSTVTPDTLSRLLACTTVLKSLEYHYWIADNAYVRCEQLMKALELVKCTLEHLEFACWTIRDITDESEGMCHFQDFLVLRSLQILPVVLLGTDALLAPRIEEVVPPSLKKLCLTDDLLEIGNKWDAKSITHTLFDLVEGNWGASAPQLEMVYVKKDEGWLNKKEEAYLRDLCRNNGLEHRM
jgi:hypothetical protein